MIWTAGTAPHPLVKILPFEKDKRGGVKVESAWPSQATPACGPWVIVRRSRTRTAAKRERSPHDFPFLEIALEHHSCPRRRGREIAVRRPACAENHGTLAECNFSQESASDVQNEAPVVRNE